MKLQKVERAANRERWLENIVKVITDIPDEDELADDAESLEALNEEFEKEKESILEQSEWT